MEHDNHGETGVFKGIFLWLGVAIGIFGIATTTYSMSSLIGHGIAGASVVTDGMILGILMIVLGVGFGVFAVMIGKEGWADPGA